MKSYQWIVILWMMLGWMAVHATEARHCDAEQKYCHVTYMVSTQYVGAILPTVIAPTAAYCSNRSNMGWAVARFAALNNSKPTYALGDLVMRPDAPTDLGADSSRLFFTHATVTQICDMDAMRCRYAAGYSVPTDMLIPGAARYTASPNVTVLPPPPRALFFVRLSDEDAACPAANDTAYPPAIMPPPDCVTFANARGAFRLCVSGLAEAILAQTCTANGAFRFCVASSASADASVVPYGLALGTAVFSGTFFSSHPLLPLVEISSTSAAVSAASSYHSFFSWSELF